MADAITGKAVSFIERHQQAPFFLYFATHDIHVPRVPHARFVGTSGCGVRGDVIQQLDWCVGQILETLDRLGLADDTLVIFSSDNGPVVDDGYADGSPEDLGDHKPSGPLWGGKYSRYEGGTRVPMIARWPGKIEPGVSDALVCHVDFLASFARLVDEDLSDEAGPDSFNVLGALLGTSPAGRDHLVEQGKDVALRRGAWKFFPSPPRKVITTVLPEHTQGQSKLLYNLEDDLGESQNLAPQNPELVEELGRQLDELKTRGRSR
jgi:arylsulfatase A-like enzyme